MADKKPDISIITVNYNVKEFLANSLQSVKKASHNIDIEIFVVDNDSKDGSMEFLKPHFPEVTFIENKENLGFGKANNQAIKLARGKYTLLLNPDTLLQEDTLEILYQYMENNPETGACGCKILNPDGTFAPESRRTVPTVGSAIYKALGLTALFPKSRVFGKYYMGWKDEDEASEVPVLSGSFMFFRTEVLKEAGGFDERFFMYGEDIDLCYRVKNAGWKIDYIPDTSIIHYKGESSKSNFSAYNKAFNDALYLFFDKHYTPRYSGIFRILVFWAIKLRTWLTFLLSKLKVVRSVISDLVIINIALFVGYIIRFWFDSRPILNIDKVEYLWLNLLISFLYILFAQLFGVLKKNRLSIVSSLKAVVFSFLFLAAITFFIRALAFSRVILAVAGILSFIGVGISRFIRINSDRKINVVRGKVDPVRMLVVGVGDKTAEFINKLNGRANWQVKVAGVVTQNKIEIRSETFQEPIVGTIDQIDELIRNTRADSVVFLMDSITHTELLRSVKKLRNHDVDIKIVPNEMNFMLGKAEVDYLDDLPVVDLEFNYFNPAQTAIKRLFDFSVSFTLLILMFPVGLLLPFRKSKLTELSIFDGTADNKIWFVDGGGGTDKWCNRFLASLWVMSGRISFTGSEVRQGDDNGAHKYKTGLTGYPQINSDRISTPKDAERFDLWYLQNYTVWLDIDILFKAFLRDDSITGKLIQSGKS